MIYPEVKPSVGKFKNQTFTAKYPDMIEVATNFEFATFLSMVWKYKSHKEFDYLARTFISGLLRLFRGTF